MFEQGLVTLIQGVVGSVAQPQVNYLVQLDKDQALPAWTYRIISKRPNYTMTGGPGLVMTRVQIDCFALTPAGVVTLADAIDGVLSGYSAALTDPNATIVDSCFLSDSEDFFDEERRTYRRMLEYEIWYIQPVQS